MKPTVGSLMNIAALASNALLDTEQSLIEYTQVVRQEPVCLVEDALVNLDVTPNIVRTLTNLFMAYYLQGVSLDNTVGGVSVLRKLDKFATHRSVKQAIGTFVDKQGGKIAAGLAGVMGMENFNHQFAAKHQKNTHVLSVESQSLCYPCLSGKPITYQLSNEAFFNNNEKNEKNEKSGESKNTPDNAEQKLVADVLNASIKTVQDAPNLVTGKLFNVVIQNEGKQAVIPASVRINTLDVSRLLMMKILARGDLKNKMLERWNRWREGEISFFGDLIMCNDLIAEHRSLLSTDKHGIYKKILKIRRDNKIAEMVSGDISIAAASSMAIVSEQTMKDLRYMIGGDYNDKDVRTEMFARCSLMFLIIVDPSLQYAKIFHRGINHPMEVTFSEFNRFAKGTGPDTMEVLRAFQAGQRPNL